MSFRIRSSKYRHVYGDPAKKPMCYDNIKISKNAHDTYFACANPKFLAVITESSGGGSFQVIPIDKVGRVDLDCGKISGHAGPVLDIKFDPFNDNVIASASEDCTVKLWHIPDSGFRETRDCLLILSGHQRRVVQIEWHPCAENVLLSAGAESWVIVWDVGRGDVIRIIDCHRDVVCSIGFNLTGNYFATTCRDLQIRLIEPRMAEVAQITPGHAGSKPSKLAFLTNRKRIFTSGFSKYSDRQFAIWDVNNLSQPLKMDILDSSSGTVFPYYDPDTSVIYLAGRGDGNIRYYELTDTTPYLHYLNQYQSSSPQRSLCQMPKRGLNFGACEIFRFYKLYATKNFVEPISMIAPRKAGIFHDDLYPDTAGPTPSLTTEEWLNGGNAAPVMISLKAGATLKTNKPVMYKADENQLITSDRNNELKFRFIADASQVDYRPLNERKRNSVDNGNDDTIDSDQRLKTSVNYSPKNLLHNLREFEEKTLNGETRRKNRYSLQEDCASENQKENNNKSESQQSRRSFQKLQRIWSDREHSFDSVTFEALSYDAEEGLEVKNISTVHEALHEMDTDRCPSIPLNSEADEIEVTDMKSERSSSQSDNHKSDKENSAPENLSSKIYREFLEQKEVIDKLQRQLKLKEEENLRLLQELESLRIRLISENPISVERMPDEKLSDTSTEDFDIIESA